MPGGQFGHRFLQPVRDLSQMGSIFAPLDQCDISEFETFGHSFSWLELSDLEYAVSRKLGTEVELQGLG